MNSKIIFITIVIYIANCANVFGQKTNCFCPMLKGVILIDTSNVNFGGKVLPIRDIIGINSCVYSASEGVVTSIDTILGNRCFVMIGYNEYTFRYENLISVSCKVGQKVLKGEILGKVEKNIPLLFAVSNNEKYIEPESILPCKVRYLGKKNNKSN